MAQSPHLYLPHHSPRCSFCIIIPCVTLLPPILSPVLPSFSQDNALSALLGRARHVHRVMLLPPPCLFPPPGPLRPPRTLFLLPFPASRCSQRLFLFPPCNRTTRSLPCGASRTATAYHFPATFPPTQSCSCHLSPYVLHHAVPATFSSFSCDRTTRSLHCGVSRTATASGWTTRTAAMTPAAPSACTGGPATP